jgi:hypothetical protein
MTAEPQAFTLAVPDQAIADLRNRLERTRCPDQAPGEPWAYSTDVGYLRKLVDYWRTAMRSFRVRFCTRALARRANLHRHSALERHAARRPLHGIGAARSARPRDTRILSAAQLGPTAG